MQTEQFNQTSACETDHWWFVARREMLRAVARQVLPASEDSLVVDIGCGTGANAAALAGDYSVVGIDPSAEAIGLARERFPEVSFLRGHVPDDLGDLAGRADLFLLADVLEHMERDLELLAGLAAMARPGAHFLITVPAEMALWSPHDVSHGHYRRYSRASFEALWSGLPLAAVGLTAFNARLYPLVRLARAWSRFRGRAWGAANTDLALPPGWLNRLLRGIFAGETNRVVRAARGETRAAYRRGVSLLAVLRRVEGQVESSNAELSGIVCSNPIHRVEPLERAEPHECGYYERAVAVGSGLNEQGSSKVAGTLRVPSAGLQKFNRIEVAQR